MAPTIPAEVQGLVERALIAFGKAHPRCQEPETHIEDTTLHLHDRESGDGGWFRVGTVPGRESVIRLTRCRPPDHPEPRDYEIQDVNTEAVPPPPTTSPTTRLRAATDALVTAGDRVSRYCSRDRGGLTMDAVPDAIREAAQAVLPFVAAKTELGMVLQDIQPTLERLRSEHVDGTWGAAPPSKLSALRQASATVYTGPSPLDALEDLVREGRGALHVANEAWPIVRSTLTDLVERFEAELPRLIQAERALVKEQIADTIEQVERTGCRGVVISLDRLAAVGQQEQDVVVVLTQIKAALA